MDLRANLDPQETAGDRLAVLVFFFNITVFVGKKNVIVTVGKYKITKQSCSFTHHLSVVHASVIIARVDISPVHSNEGRRMDRQNEW